MINLDIIKALILKHKGKISGENHQDSQTANHNSSLSYRTSNNTTEVSAPYPQKMIQYGKNEFENRIIKAVNENRITIEHIWDKSLANRMSDYQIFKTIEEKAQARILKVALCENLFNELFTDNIDCLTIENKINMFSSRNGLDKFKTFDIISIIYNCFRQNTAPKLHKNKNQKPATIQTTPIIHQIDIPAELSSLKITNYREQVYDYTTASISSDKTVSKNSQSSTEIIKETFKRNPEQAKKLYGNEYTYGQTGGRTLYKGNCILNKQCILALCKYMGLETPTFAKSNGKHSLTFYVRHAICTYTNTGADITCPISENSIMLRMASYVYPQRFITTQSIY